jgi:hypothetical protein
VTTQYQVKGPDGVVHIIAGPDDARPDQIVAAAAQLIPQASARRAMTTREDIYTAIRNADAAGDSDSVRKLGAYLQTLPPDQPAAPADQPGAIASLGAGLGEGFGKTVLGAQSLYGKLVKELGSDDLAGKAMRILAMGTPVGGLVNAAAQPSAPTITGLVTGQQPQNLLQRTGSWLVNDAAQGRAKNAGELQPFAEAHPTAAGAGQVGGEIIATLPVGGVIAKGLGTAAKVLPAAARVLDPLATAAGSGGLKTGIDTATMGGKAADIAARVAGGGMTGGAGTVLVDPEHAGEGAIIGAAVPPVLKGIGAAAAKAAPYVVPPLKAAATSIANTVRSPATQGAHELMTALDITPDQLGDVLDKLRNAPELVPGSTPTVSQALQMPQASILERVVGASPGGTRVLDAKGIQSDARQASLRGVAPVDPSGFESARDSLGRSVTNRVIPEERAISDRISAMYEGIDPNKTAEIPLPLDDMRAAAYRPGSFGKNQEATLALKTAEGLSPLQATPAGGMGGAAGSVMAPRPAAWNETNTLRSSLGEAITRAADQGDRQAVASLSAQKAAVDEAIKKNLSPDALAAFLEANDSHAAKMDRFHTGPQAAIFRNASPARGGEVGNAFWGNRPGLADDVESFKKLIGDNPALLGQFRSMVTTDAAAKAIGDKVGPEGELGQRFVDWTQSMLPGLERAFDPKEVQTLQNIAADVKRAAKAAKLGRDGGSDTYQKAANALDAGLWDMPLTKVLMDRIPGVNLGTAPIRASLAESASKAKARRLADLLVDPQAAAAALSGTQPGPIRGAVRGGLSSLTGTVGGALANDPTAQRGALSALDMALQPGQQ